MISYRSGYLFIYYVFPEVAYLSWQVFFFFFGNTQAKGDNRNLTIDTSTKKIK